MPCIEKMTAIDMRTQVFDVVPQEVYVRTKLRSIWSFHLKVLTKDSVTVSVDAVVYYRVSNATISVANVENAHHSTRKD